MAFLASLSWATSSPSPPLIGFQIGQDRPVFRIDWGPDHAPVLQFSKGFKVIRATFDSPQVLAADARQVKDWNHEWTRINTNIFLLLQFQDSLPRREG